MKDTTRLWGSKVWGDGFVMEVPSSTRLLSVLVIQEGLILRPLGSPLSSRAPKFKPRSYIIVEPESWFFLDISVTCVLLA